MKKTDIQKSVDVQDKAPELTPFATVVETAFDNFWDNMRKLDAELKESLLEALEPYFAKSEKVDPEDCGDPDECKHHQ